MKNQSEDWDPAPVFDCMFCANQMYAIWLVYKECLVSAYAGGVDWLLHTEMYHKFKYLSVDEFLNWPEKKFHFYEISSKPNLWIKLPKLPFPKQVDSFEKIA